MYDLRPALDAAASGLCLSARQLEGVANTLQVAFAAKDAASVTLPGQTAFRFPALAAIATGILDSERDTMGTIFKCVKVGWAVRLAQLTVLVACCRCDWRLRQLASWTWQ